MGCEGISKNQESRICRGLDEVVDKFLINTLDRRSYAYLWLDALTQKVREEDRIVNVRAVVCTSEHGALWLSFSRRLVA